MSDFYQLSNSSSDFKSRSNDVFDRLINLEKQHDVQTQHQTPAVAVEDETPSTVANPNVPNNAIIFKKRSADETTFARPENKWKKYDLEDVNEHHLSETANRRALNEFFRTRPKPDEEKEEKAELVQRPRKKEILPEKDEDEDQPRQIEIRATTKVSSRHDELDTPSSFRLSKPKKTRGVFSTNKKSTIKEQINESDDDEQDGDEDEDEFFEP